LIGAPAILAFDRVDPWEVLEFSFRCDSVSSLFEHGSSEGGEEGRI
jgi:hypothetical protein